MIDVYHHDSSKHTHFIHCDSLTLSWLRAGKKKNTGVKRKRKTKTNKLSYHLRKGYLHSTVIKLNFKKEALQDYIFRTKFKVPTLHLFFPIILPPP